MKRIKVAILISGRGSNMKALIDAARDKNFPAEIALVISNKENALGLDVAKNEGIKTVFIDHKKFATRQEFDLEMIKEIEKNNCQIVCLAGFMRLLSREFVKHFDKRMINIHPSLLPEFKGANAVADALKAGAKISGCTTHFVSEEMDSGEIIMQAEVEVLADDTEESLAKRILEKEHLIYPKSLRILCEELMN